MSVMPLIELIDASLQVMLFFNLIYMLLIVFLWFDNPPETSEHIRRMIKAVSGFAVMYALYLVVPR
ncbi:MAG: hypothetical protein SF123_07685 [Chloroflexota bacterium]|nr:hypothetical protein [Chloroflexota bacterium]